MKELSREKRLEIAHCYLLGHTYGEIEAETGVSHGTLANIIQELVNGKLAIAGTSFDRINDLRILALDLKKEGLQSSQAVLGFSVFQRLQALGITPEHLERWADLLKQFSKPDFTPADFLEMALSLAKLEKSQAKPFDTLAEEYKKLAEGVAKLGAEVDSLRQRKADLTKEIEPLNLHLQALEKAKNDLEYDVKKETIRLQELKPKVKEAEETKAQLSRETKDRERKRAKLSAEVDGKEQSLKKLYDLGLSAEDLLHLTIFIGKTSEKEGIAGHEVKRRFFSTLALFEDVSGLEERRKTEADQINEMVRKNSILTGQILQLEKRKGVLEGEIGDSISGISQKILDVGTNAAFQLAQQVSDMKAQLNGLLTDALVTGKAVGEMKAMQMNGEKSCRKLEDFIKEAKGKVEVH